MSERGILTWFIVFSYLSVTVFSSIVFKSIVTANGMHNSSVLAYFFPIAVELSSILHVIRAFLRFFSNLMGNFT